MIGLTCTDPKGRNIGGGRMTIHGTITISAKVQDLNETSDGGGMSGTGTSTNDENSSNNTLGTNNNSLVDSTQRDQFKTSDEEPALRDYNSNYNTST